MQDKKLIKDVLNDSKDFARTVSFCKRNFEFEENGNYVFVGIRRAGKSYLMYQRMHELVQKGSDWNEILYVNFEDERLSEMTSDDFNLILEIHYELFNTKPILFLDEIQNISGWEKFVRRMADSKYRIYVTGSNAKMLSTDVATTLGGRFLIKNIFPYSFSEFLQANSFQIENIETLSTKNKGEILNRFGEYFRFGGFPENLLMSNKREYISSLFQKIYLGDICTRNSITNSYSLKIMLKKIAESVKQPISYNRIANILSAIGIKIGVSTVINYTKYSEESCLLIKLRNFASKIAEKESNPKYYFADNGLLNLFLTDPETSLLENLVANILFRKYGLEDSVFFYNENVEIDFYIPEVNKAIQVSYSISEEETRVREVKALKKFAERFDCSDLTIITYDEEYLIEENQLKIKVIPVWKFALELQ